MLVFNCLDGDVPYTGTKVIRYSGTLSDAFEIEPGNSLDIPFARDEFKDFLTYVEYESYKEWFPKQDPSVAQVLTFGLNVSKVADFLNYKRDPNETCLEEKLDNLLLMTMIDVMEEYLQTQKIDRPTETWAILFFNNGTVTGK